MPTAATVLADLKSRATEPTRRTYIRHGHPPDRTLGVSAADMKLIAKTIKKQQALACELYDTGFLEARYLAGLVANGALMTKTQLNKWADAAADMTMVSEFTIPWVALENPAAHALALEWIASKKEHVAAAGWATYNGLLITAPDDALDLREIETLLKSIPAKITSAPNRVKSKMNSFVIAVGTYVVPLHKQALAAAKQLGAVAVDVGDTDCEVPLATERIARNQAAGRTAKRKTIRC